MVVIDTNVVSELMRPTRDAAALEVIGAAVHSGSYPLDAVERRRRSAPELPHEQGSPDGPASEHSRTGPGDDEERLELPPEPRTDGGDFHEAKHPVNRFETR